MRVALFDGTNYPAWKYRMLVTLEEHEVSECTEQEIADRVELVVNPTDTTEVKKEKEEKLKIWQKKERKCKALIISRIADSQIEYVQEHRTPKAIWDSLSRVFERKSVAKRMYLSRQLKELQYEGGPLQQHFLKYESLVRQLRGVGAVMEEVDVVCGLLLSFGEEYATVVTTLETLPVDTLTLEFAKCRLLDEEIKRGVVSSTAEPKQESSAFGGRATNKKIKCYYCQKLGHKSYECPEKKSSRPAAHFARGNDDDDRDGVCFFFQWPVVRQ